MAKPVRSCGDHGFFEGERCPVCGDSGTPVLDSDRRERLSRFVSGALRHFPDDAGIELDEAGWTDYETVVTSVERKYDWASETELGAVIETDPKGRFERDGKRVRAVYGHSVEVDLDSGDGPVPDTLYHGTAPRNLDSIRAEGLKPMGRQSVHLSGTIEEARAVGERHASEAVVLEIDADGMLEDGREITKRGKGTYTTEAVPPEYLTVIERP